MAWSSFRRGFHRWTRQGGSGSAHRQAATLGAAPAVAAACTLANKRLHSSPLLAQDDDMTAADLRPYHLATRSTGGRGLVDESNVNTVLNPIAVSWPGFNFLKPNEMVRGHILLNDSKARSRPIETSQGMIRANACRDIYWEPKQVKAGIVCCGGLCPGLNSIVREVTNCLIFEYGVSDIHGFQFGYNGILDPVKYPPYALDNDKVRMIHLEGGCTIKCGRGGSGDFGKLCDNLEKMGINQLYVVGGEGTQMAGYLLSEEARKRKMPISIVGIPKSMDSDVLFFDKTFGYDTAVAEAQKVIRCAHVEASSVHNGVGIVRLFGRNSGFVAQNATISSTLVDVTLIPEVTWKLQDVLDQVEKVLQRKGHAVIVVAEGAGQDLVSTGKFDATGHEIYGDIGAFLNEKVNAHVKKMGGRTFYINPSYIIRSVPITPNDHVFCTRLSHDAVHTAMRGYTGVCVGPVYNVICMIPSTMIAQGQKKIRTNSAMWQLAVEASHMPASLGGLEGTEDQVHRTRSLRSEP